MKKTVIALSLFGAIFTIGYWSSVFLGLFPVTETVPGYTTWFMSFPIADLWLASMLFLTAISYLKGSSRTAYFGVAAGSSFIFLALYALTYGFVSGSILTINTDTILEIFIKVYSLTVGALLLLHFRPKREA